MRNFVERYVDYASKLTEAPKIFHYYMGYMILSQVVGCRATCSYADYNAGPNMWMIFIGSSSIARKSSSWKIGLDILDEVFNAELGPQYRLPNDGSYEAWIEYLDAKKDPESGVAEGIMVFDEFKRLHDWLSQKYTAQLEGLLLSTYDQTPIHRRVGTRKEKKEYSIKHPYLNIVASSTMSLFNKSVTNERIESGFLPRFQIICSDDCGTLIPLRPMPDFAVRNSLIEQLKNIRATIRGQYTYSKEAVDYYNKWYAHVATDLITKSSEHMIPFLSRRRSDVHKYAMLNCIMRNDSSRVMSLTDVEQAIEESMKNVLMYTESVINDKLTTDKFQSDRMRVYDIIKAKQNGNGGVHHSLILKLSKMNKKNFDEIINTLAEEESIIINREKTAGRPAVFYQVAPDTENAHHT